MASWDKYAMKKTLREVGAEQKGYEVVKNLISADKFSNAEIANFANLPETFVRKVKRQIK
ncbi:MAG TPA: hypothetical protein VFI29_00390 [Hanamia sp.]|nr:hypothetical protein [Hanamia sp.]